jgi:hypothetical protein
MGDKRPARSRPFKKAATSRWKLSTVMAWTALGVGGTAVKPCSLGGTARQLRHQHAGGE